MVHDSVFIEGSMTRIISLNTLIVGGGIAGLSAAVYLYDKGCRDLAVLLDSAEGAVSLHAGSNHQAYYKMTDAGSSGDSPYRMAKALNVSGNMDGDQALMEAAMSSRCFYRLLEMGVPFEEDRYGAFGNAKGASENERRQASAGEQTSRHIMAALKLQLKERQIPVYENYQLVRIVTSDDHEARGVIALNKEGIRERHLRFVLFNAADIIMATGGPGGLFYHEAYPKFHYGCLGTMLRAGAEGQNLGEFTFGLCAVKKSLMMNGIYQGCLPRYVSTDSEGKDIQEFLLPYFENPSILCSLQKMKSTQWQFDVKKVRSDGVSLIDLLVYNEIITKGRHVFLDFRENPSGLSSSELADGAKPYERLLKRSPEAYAALLDHDFDPQEQPVEIYPSMVHHNGGIAVDLHSESSLKHLYVIGEAAGTHGSILPEGASINQTQVTALRAAESIIRSQEIQKVLPAAAFAAFAAGPLHECVSLADSFLSRMQNSHETDPSKKSLVNIRAMRIMIGKRMDKIASLYLDQGRLKHEIEKAVSTLKELKNEFQPFSRTDLCQLFEIEDLLTVQICVLSALLDTVQNGKGSQGSHLIYDASGTIPSEKLNEMYRFSVSGWKLANKIQNTVFHPDTFVADNIWRNARPIPKV